MEHSNTQSPDYWGLVTLYGVNVGSDNGLLPDGTKPLPELSLLTYYQLGLEAFTWGKFQRKYYIYEFEKSEFEIANALPKGKWVNTMA